VKYAFLAAWAFLAPSLALATAASEPVRLAFANGTVHLEASWMQGPRSPEESVLRLEWKAGDSRSPAEPPGTFRVSLWMPDMGHGSAPTRVQSLLDEHGQPLVGAYRASNLYFTMGGTWEVRVTLKYAGGKEETRAFRIELHEGARLSPDTGD